MQKPIIINTFVGDSLSLRIAVYDEDGRPFDNTTFAIDTVNLVINGLESSPISGEISSHLVTAFIPSDTFTEAVDSSFYIQLINTANEVCFTIATGTLHVVALPA